MSEELRECPFCGGRPRTGETCNGYVVICNKCGCRTPICDKKSDAWEKWESRAQPDNAPICPLLSDDEVKQPCIEGPCPATCPTFFKDDNPPLSLEYLKQINGDMENRRWIWIEVIIPSKVQDKESAYYRVQSDYTQGRAFCCGYPGCGYSFDYADYTKTWLAYQSKPEPQSKPEEGEKA
jgi:hypothetical protein